ncbi:MAG: hypothetical protein RL199_1460, partial [Pseudomonadota bacterium]
MSRLFIRLAMAVGVAWLAACQGAPPSGAPAAGAASDAASARHLDALAVASVDDCSWPGGCSWPDATGDWSGQAAGGWALQTTGVSSRAEVGVRFSMQGTAFPTAVAVPLSLASQGTGTLSVELRADAAVSSAGVLLAVGRLPAAALAGASLESPSLVPIALAAVAPVTPLVSGRSYWMRLTMLSEAGQSGTASLRLYKGNAVSSATTFACSVTGGSAQRPATCAASNSAAQPDDLAFIPYFSPVALPSCLDGLTNGNESDVDCGGSCTPCAAKARCGSVRDCQSSMCAPTATTVADPASVDCTATTCLCQKVLADGATCTADANCRSGRCEATAAGRRCVPERCFNGSLAQPVLTPDAAIGETDVDCGGSVCVARCSEGRKCRIDTDCDATEGLVCISARSSVGTCQPRQAPGGACYEPADCVETHSCSAVSSRGAGTCTDRSVRTTGAACRMTADCADSFACFDGTCRPLISTTSTATCSRSDQCEPRTAADGSSVSLCVAGRCAAGPVEAGAPCTAAKDCASRICSAGTCRAATTADRVRNGEETDVDCGGSAAPACVSGRKCAQATDCASGACLSGVCVGKLNDACSSPAGCDAGLSCLKSGKCGAGSCADGVVGPGETDVDCGGVCAGAGTLKRCSARRRCAVSSDCQSGVCGASGTCVAASCSDGIQNGTEAGVDCGGGCGGCPAGVVVPSAASCGSQSATATDDGRQVCTDAVCTDDVRNGNETDLDCGGSCAPAQACAKGKRCIAPTDCAAGLYCTGVKGRAGLCQQWTADGRKNLEETDVDCGGRVAPACAESKTCVQTSDCADGRNCLSGRCLSAPSVTQCTDGTRNLLETDVDCGGTACLPCEDGKSCRSVRDCASGVCGVDGKCRAAANWDGVVNATETDVDCGGSSQNVCVLGQRCR